MKLEQDIERVFLTRDNIDARWPDVGAAVKRWLDDGVRVEIKPKTETRRDIQNRLFQRWCGQIAKHEGHDQPYVFGRTKLDILLPIKLADDKEHERAAREKLMIDGAVAMLFASGSFDGVSPRELRIDAAADTVRSKDIGVRLFASMLTTLRHQASESGVLLMSRQDEIDEALMGQHAAQQPEAA